MKFLSTLSTISMIVFYAVMAFSRRWMSDDGFINLRIVENFLNGYGPVYNISERVEAYTSPLWLGVLSLLGLLGIRLEHGAVYCSLSLSVAGLVLASMGALRLSKIQTADHREPGIPIPLGIGIYSAVAVTWDYATSGLEMGMTMAWLGLSFFKLVGLITSRRRARVLVYFFIIGLGPLIRPELALYSITMGAAGLCIATRIQSGRLRLRFLALCLLSMLLLPVAYQLFRMGYFAALTPNTAIAKEAFSLRWYQGGNFLWNTIGVYHLYVPLAAVLFSTCLSLRSLLSSRQRIMALVLTAPMVGAILHGLYVIGMGGGFMHGRLLLPALFAFLMPFYVRVHIAATLEKRARLVEAILSITLLAWMITSAIAFRVERENEHHIGDERGWYSRMAKRPNPIAVEDYSGFKFYKNALELKEGVRGDRVVLVDVGKFGRLKSRHGRFPLRSESVKDEVAIVAHRVAIGMTGYACGPEVHIVDHAGLADPIASRLVLEERGRPGHEKKMTNYWMVGRFGETSTLSDARCKDAYLALQCGDLKELMDAVTAPMTFDRFMSNIALSFKLQRLKIPKRTDLAKEKFCGRMR